MTVRILQGDCRVILKTLASDSVHCVVTSPPYWNLRDYQHPDQIGLEDTLEEYLANMVAVFREVRRVLRGDGTLWLNMGDSYSTGTTAGRTPGARGIGAETQLAQDAVRRNGSPMGLKAKDLVGQPWRLAFALQADGWWLRQDIIWHKPNPMPESVYDRCTKSHEYIFLLAKSERYYYDAEAIKEPVTGGAHSRGHGLNPKALADRGDVRSKQNESFSAAISKRPPNGGRPAGWSTDLAGDKSSIDWMTADRQERGGDTGVGWGRLDKLDPDIGDKGRDRIKRSGNKERKPASDRGVPVDTDGETNGAVAGSIPWEGTHRNKRSVWSVVTQPFKEAHFATFPVALIEPCILAGTSEKGCCSKCGAPWERVIAKVDTGLTQKMPDGFATYEGGHTSVHRDSREKGEANVPVTVNETVGWEPGCECEAELVPCVVMDIFGGAGTTALVSDRLHRNAISIELNPSYVDMQHRRIADDSPLFAQVTA